MFFIYLIIALITLIYFYIRNCFQYFEKHNIPYCKPSIPLGNLQNVGRTVHLGERIHQIYQQLKTSELLYYGIYIFTRPMIIPTNLDLIKTILIKEFNNFQSRNQYYNERDDPLSAHLVNVDGIKWKNLRSKITPTFTSGKMRMMCGTIIEVGEQFAKSLQQHFHKTESNNNVEHIEIEMKEMFGRFTTDVIGSCVFGIQCNSLNDPDAIFFRMGQKIFAPELNSMNLKFFCDSFPNLCRTFRIVIEQKDATKFLHKALKETIDYRLKHNIERNDFLNLMMQFMKTEKDDDKLTFNEIAAQCYVFFAAGFETSSTTLSFCIYELVRNPEIQCKAHQQIRTILAKYNGQLTYDSIMEMTYIHQIIDETLRIYPPVPIIPRYSCADFQIPNTNRIIKKDTMIGIPVYSIHHDSDYYENPEIFDPDRFTPENCQNRHPCSYLPFGEGPRNCIGLRFGKLESYIGLVSLLKDMKFSKCSRTPDSKKFNPKTFFLSLQDPLWVKIELL